MGVAIGQQLNRCKGYYDATEIEAGDVSCRALRARALTQLGRLDDAERELDLATPLAERGSYTGHAAEIRGARRDLERARGR
jgi:hypothetical protein